jgi:hypothetical protein
MAPVNATAPAVERELAADLLRRAVLVTPVAVAVAGLWKGLDGAVAIVLAVALVGANFALAAAGQAWAVHTGRAALIAANALGGFALRLLIVLGALLALRHQPWIHFAMFAIALAVSHLGLLFWEFRSVSATLAYPGLKPRPAHD